MLLPHDPASVVVTEPVIRRHLIRHSSLRRSRAIYGARPSRVLNSAKRRGTFPLQPDCAATQPGWVHGGSLPFELYGSVRCEAQTSSRSTFAKASRMALNALSE